MTFTTLDLIFNLLILLFWMRLWSPADDRLAHFNPHLNLLAALPAKLIRLLHPALPRLPEQTIAGLVICALLVLRAAAAPQTETWTLRLGFSIFHLPSGAPAGPRLLFSLASFSALLFRLWALSILYLALAGNPPATQTGQALHAIARPFTRLPPAWRPALLMLLGTGLCMALAFGLNTPVTIVGLKTAQAAIGTTLTPVGIAQCALMALAGWADILLLMEQLMIYGIIGSIVAMLTGAGAVMFFCREWIDFLLGPLRHYPLRIGPLDLSPLIFLFGARFIYMFLSGLLLRNFFQLL